MIRRVAPILMVIISLAVPSSALAQQATAPSDEEPSLWVDDATFALLEEVALLAELRAFTPEPSLGFIVNFMATPGNSREFAIGELFFVDELNAAMLDELAPAQMAALSDEVTESLRALPASSVAAIEAGDVRFIDPGPWLGAITDLMLRQGRAPQDRRVDDSRLIIDTLATLLTSDTITFAAAAELIDQHGPLRPLAPPAPLVNREQSPIGAVSAEPAVTLPAEPAKADATWRWIALAVGAAITASLATILLLRRRRDSTTTAHPRVAGVLDAGRRMTGALNEDEVMAIAVAESVELASADVGAFALPRQAGAVVTSSSDTTIFASGLVRGGALSRVLETGQAIVMIAQTEPFLTQPPMAVAIVPAIASGGVAGAVIVARHADRPFTSGDISSVELLAPTMGTALIAAAEHDSMATAADVDAMTDLKNRRRLDHDLGELDGESTLCFAMIDVDHFKRFNDSHGHLAGDIALQSVARAIESGVRESDTVYRFGGEEFSVLLRGSGVAEAMRVLERVRVAVESTPVPGADGTPHFLTVSAGVVANDNADPMQLPQLADEALYAAKHAGRNRVVATSSL